MIQLSVVVPSYNSEDCLGKCLESMCDGRFAGKLEVLVVDDGSFDDTARIAGQYMERMPEVFRLISKANGGHGSAVNSGIDAARGKYFRIVDSDDWVETDGLLRLLDAMNTASPDIFIDERIEYHEDDGFTELIKLPMFARDSEMLPFEDVTGMEYARCVSMHTLTVRTDLLRETGVRLLEHTYYVDMQYVIAVTSCAHTVYLLRQGVYNYRLGSESQSVSHINYVKNYTQHDRVLKACAEYYTHRRESLPAGRDAYMRLMLTLLARTQYNIALIYNPDRREGLRQARELSAYLSRQAPWLARATRSRRVTACVLHSLGIGYNELQRLKAAAGRA